MHLSSFTFWHIFHLAVDVTFAQHLRLAQFGLQRDYFPKTSGNDASLYKVVLKKFRVMFTADNGVTVRDELMSLARNVDFSIPNQRVRVPTG